MKFNKWTLGLAAVGAVSMASAVRADEAKLSQLNTAVAGTVISGYVDVGAQYNAGNAGGNQPIYGVGTPDGFSVNVFDVSLDKALDDSPWASGYHIDINGGSYALSPLNDGGFGARQAYVALRTPVGNGIDWKVGLFDGITGYESNVGYTNPNYTRSYGWELNPASFAGILGAYKVSDVISLQAGIANRGSGTNFISGANRLSAKSFIGAVTLTAPESLGFLKGSTLNASTVQGFDNGAVNIYSVNATLSTPVAGLKVGLAYDKQESLAADHADGNIFGVYANYQATEKLGFNLRGEYIDGQNLGYFNNNWGGSFGNGSGKGQEITATVQYDLWANVVSRVEFRWDHTESGTQYNLNGTENAYLLALNLVYKF